MKSNYIVRAMKFLNEFLPYMDGCSSPSDYQMMTDMFCDDHKGRKVLCCYGIARVAIITSDYVVKFDYSKKACDFYGGCEDEVKFYDFAVREGFAHLFAEITHVSVGGRDFYIMPRVKGVMRRAGHYAEEFFFGEERAFIDENLNDLHDENYGWVNNRPVIFDYAMNRFTEERR